MVERLGTDEWNDYLRITITNAKRNKVYKVKVTNFQKGFTFNTKVSGWPDKMDNAKYLNDYIRYYNLYKDTTRAERNELLNNEEIQPVYEAAENLAYKRTKSATAFAKVSAAKSFYNLMKPIEQED